MCGRTSLAVHVSDLENRFDVEIDADGVPMRYNIAPREDLLTVTNEAPDRATFLNWGLVPHWADDADAVHRPINARAETVAEKPYFRDAYRARRCLVLADGYYEWRGDRRGARPYRIDREDGEPFAMAGLWERWRGGDDDLRTCTILTTDASAPIEPIHDRMPLLLEPDEEATWLRAGDDPLGQVGDAYPDEALCVYEVSTRVNDPTNDDPSVLDPVTQTGLDEFGA